jgi:hypothetical protein
MLNEFIYKLKESILLSDSDYEKDIYQRYEKRCVDLQRSYIILVGFGLFFLFMILIPFYSLKHDSTIVANIGWLNDNTSRILFLFDEILNSSKIIDNSIQVYIDTSNKPVVDVKNYANALNSIKYFNQTLRLPADNEIIQGAMGKLVIYSNCVDKNNVNEWIDCNLKEQISSTANDMFITFNKTKPTIDQNLEKIDEAVRAINNSNLKLSKQIESSVNVVDFADFNKLVKEAKSVISNTTTSLVLIDQKLNSTAKIRPSSPLDFYLVYPAGKVYAFDTLRAVINKVLTSNQKSDLQRLKNELDGIKMNINEETQKLEGRFNQFQSPLGNIPIGFNEAVGIFPAALAGGFSVYVYLLIDTNRLRRRLLDNFNRHYLNLQSRIDRHVSMLSPLWIDPFQPLRQQPVQICILFIPFLIFLVAFVMVLDIILFFESPFPFAVNTNKYLYSISSLIGLFLFIYSYTKFFTAK